MASSKSTAIRYGSIHGMDGLHGSEHHRRTNSNAASSYSTPNRATPNRAEPPARLSGWKFPSPPSASSSAASSPFGSTPATSPETHMHKSELLPSAHVNLNSIEESDSDETYSSDGSPRSKHRSSPSLPYGPMTTSYSPAYNKARHTNPLFRFDRVSFLRFLNSHLRQLRAVDLGYGLVFGACLLVFMGALTGVGYSPAALQTLPLPSFQLSADQIPPVREAVRQEPALAEPVVQPAVEDFKPVEAPVRRVEPLKAQAKDTDAPLVITDEADPADEELPSWARPNAARLARAAQDEAAAATAAPLPRFGEADGLKRRIMAPEETVLAAAEQYAEPEDAQHVRTAANDAFVEQVVAESEVDRLIREDLAQANDSASEAGADDEHIGDSPADPALDDAHAAHYHHADPQNIFAKAPSEPEAHSHEDGAHHHLPDVEEESAVVEDDDTEDDGEDDDMLTEDSDSLARYSIEMNEEGQYVVRLVDGRTVALEDFDPNDVPNADEAEAAEAAEDEVEGAGDYKPRRAIALR